MTTIAYRDGTMAADTSSVFGSTVMLRNHTKIVRVEDSRRIWLVGCAGGSALCAGVRQWALDGAKGFPELGEDDDQSATALVAKLDKRTGDVEVWLYELDGAYQINEEYVAIGSGMDFALTAMWMGGSPWQAVKAAIVFDTKTNGRVEAVRFGRVAKLSTLADLRKRKNAKVPKKDKINLS